MKVTLVSSFFQTQFFKEFTSIMIPDGSTNTCPLKSNPERKPRVEAAPRMHRAMGLNPVAALPQSNSLELLKSKDIGVYSTRGGENHGSRGRDGGFPLSGRHLLQLGCHAKLNCSGR